MSSAYEKKDLLSELNRPILDEMLKFFNGKSGRLTKPMVSEFRDFVSNGVRAGPEFFLLTSLGLLTSGDVSRYTRRLAGEFYENHYLLGKVKLSRLIKKHIKDSEVENDN